MAVYYITNALLQTVEIVVYMAHNQI